MACRSNSDSCWFWNNLNSLPAPPSALLLHSVESGLPRVRTCVFRLVQSAVGSQQSLSILQPESEPLPAHNQNKEEELSAQSSTPTERNPTGVDHTHSASCRGRKSPHRGSALLRKHTVKPELSGSKRCSASKVGPAQPTLNFRNPNNYFSLRV